MAQTNKPENSYSSALPQMKRQLHGKEKRQRTSGVGGESEDQACQLFLRQSWHWVNLACWQRQARQHLSIHPETS